MISRKYKFHVPGAAQGEGPGGPGGGGGGGGGARPPPPTLEKNKIN